MAYTRAWDETQPPDTQLANLLGQDIRQLEQNLSERISSFGAGLLASRPTPEAVWGNANFGVMYFATDTSQVFRWTGAAWSDITGFLFNRSFTDVTAVAVQNGTLNTVNIPASACQIGSIVRITAFGQCPINGITGADGLFSLKFGATAVSILDVTAADSAFAKIFMRMSADVLITGAATQRASGSVDSMFSPNRNFHSSQVDFTSPTEAINGVIAVSLVTTGGFNSVAQTGGALFVTII